MKKIQLLLLVPIALLALNSCQKIEGTVLTGNNSTSASYQPLTSGSTWTYRTDYSTSGFSLVDTTVIVMSAKTFTINGKVYQQAYQHEPSYPTLIDTGYYYAQNHVYSIMQVIGASAGSSSASYSFEMKYLDDSLPVGGTWTANSTGLALSGKIVEKGISKTVAGKTFSNVIHTEVAVVISSSGVSANITYEMYIAQGVGLIHLDAISPGSPVIPEDLIAYTIK